MDVEHAQLLLLEIPIGSEEVDLEAPWVQYQPLTLLGPSAVDANSCSRRPVLERRTAPGRGLQTPALLLM